MRAKADSVVRRSERGYSLLEVLIVLAIVALVATLVGPRLMKQLDRSKVTSAKIQMRSLSAAMETMRLDLGRYPSEDEGFRALLDRPGDEEAADRWSGPYLEGSIPKDPWGRDYIYEAPGETADRPNIRTLGGDGVEGGSGVNADLSLDAL